MVVKVIPNEKGMPAGKLADLEVYFTEGPFTGLKLQGFAVWERRTGTGRNLTVPARTYSVNGERRSFALLRPVDSMASQDVMRAFLLEAYAAWEAAEAEAALSQVVPAPVAPRFDMATEDPKRSMGVGW